MKTTQLHKLTFVLLLFTSFNLFGQSVPNPYMEWFDTKTSGTPAAWAVSGLTSKINGPSAGSALRLQNEFATGKTSSASLLKFDVLDRQAPAFGINNTPDSVKITFRTSLPKDTAFIYCYAMKSGDSFPTVFQEIMLTGSQNWTTRSFSLDYIHPDAGVVCDTAYMIIYSANPISGPNGNGYLDLAGIQFSKGTQPLKDIPNYNFATWNTTAVEYPGDWTTHHLLLFNEGLNSNYSSKSSDAQSGSFSLKLKGELVVSPNGKKDTFPAFAVTSRSREMMDLLSPDLETPSFALGSRPASIHAYVKSNLAKGDQLMVVVNLFNADSIVGSVIYLLDSSIGSYKHVSADLAWLPGYSGNADKATIGIYLTDKTGFSVLSINSEAFIDNIWFENFGVGTKPRAKQTDFSIYPNPASSSTRIQFNGTDKINLILMGQDGRMLRNFPNTANGSILALGDISAGIYHLISPETGISKKIIILP